MVLKWIFDRAVAFLGLLFLWPILLIVAIMVKIKMPAGPADSSSKSVSVKTGNYSIARSSVR